jgi:sulfide dehydrogenase cytochrome subunit
MFIPFDHYQGAVNRIFPKCVTLFFPLFCFILSGENAWATDAKKLVETCTICHGVGSAESGAPSLNGYSEIYISLSVDQFQKKERSCDEVTYPSGEKKGAKTSMCEISRDLTDEDIEQLAQYYSEQNPVRVQQVFDAQLAELGAGIHDSKCDECHGKSGSSPENGAGVLGGQQMDYLRKQIGYMRGGQRKAAKKMKIQLDKLSPPEIEALVNYYGSMR